MASSSARSNLGHPSDFKIIERVQQDRPHNPESGSNALPHRLEGRVRVRGSGARNRARSSPRREYRREQRAWDHPPGKWRFEKILPITKLLAFAEDEVRELMIRVGVAMDVKITVPNHIVD